jgi:chitodextrinase
VLGNYSSYTSTVTHTTVKDTTAPPIPTTPVLTPGFRGFGAYWTGGDAEDLWYYDIRWAAGESPPSDDSSWSYAQAQVTKVFVDNLTENLLYWFQVQGKDTSGNVSGWTTAVSVTPTLIGAADIAANSITAAMIQAGALDADKIGTGTLTINSALSSRADGILVLNGSEQEIIRIDENGIKISVPGTGQYMLLDAGILKFNDGSGDQTAITPEGINASAITFGSSQGGHNLALNSSFELAGFVTAPSSAVFTDNSGTPGWKAANRTTAPVNTTEGAADLQATAVTY